MSRRRIDRQAIYRALCEIAERGEPCPTNNDLAADFGFSSPATASVIMDKLERDGLLAIERHSSGRRVTILATGKTIETHKVMGRPDYSPKKVCQLTEDDLAARRDAVIAERRARELRHLEAERERYNLPRRGTPLSEMAA